MCSTHQRLRVSIKKFSNISVFVTCINRSSHSTDTVKLIEFRELLIACFVLWPMCLVLNLIVFGVFQRVKKFYHCFYMYECIKCIAIELPQQYMQADYKLFSAASPVHFFLFLKLLEPSFQSNCLQPSLSFFIITILF